MLVSFAFSLSSISSLNVIESVLTNVVVIMDLRYDRRLCRRRRLPSAAAAIPPLPWRRSSLPLPLPGATEAPRPLPLPGLTEAPRPLPI